MNWRGYIKNGYQIGAAGIKSPCPEDYEHERPHDRRDAWTDGYKAGWREFRRNRVGYSRASIAHNEAAKGRLWFEGKDEYGYQAIYDCEGGTLLAKIKLDGETSVLVPKGNLSPEMAMLTAKALQKAADIAYRVQKEREYKPATHDELYIPPELPHVWKQRGAGRDTEETLFLLEQYNQAVTLQRDIKTLYWKTRQMQTTEGLYERIQDRLRQLVSAFSNSKSSSE